jgi:hypothetical protein
MQERMLRGELYRPDDPELLAAQERCAGLLDRYNATRHDEREALLGELLGSVGAGAVVTRDLSAGVVAYGNPARVVREIGERDRVLLP